MFHFPFDQSRVTQSFGQRSGLLLLLLLLLLLSRFNQQLTDKPIFRALSIFLSQELWGSSSNIKRDDGGRGQKCPKLRDVIYGRPLYCFLQIFFKLHE